MHRYGWYLTPSTPHVDAPLNIPEADTCLAAYRAAGCRVNTPDVLAHETAWLTTVLPALLPADNDPASAATDSIVTAARRQLRNWLHRSGDRPAYETITSDQQWITSSVNTITRLLNATPACGCDACGHDNVDQCADLDVHEYPYCDCCNYYCTGHACQDDYCRGCDVCERETITPAKRAFATDAIAALTRLEQTHRTNTDNLHVTGHDDHDVLVPLPATPELTRHWHPDAPTGAPVTAKRITVNSPYAVRAVTDYLNRKLSSNSHSRARVLVTSGNITGLTHDTVNGRDRYRATVKAGSSQGVYRTEVTTPTGRRHTTARSVRGVHGSCTCPMSKGTDTWCKHSAAILYLLASGVSGQ